MAGEEEEEEVVRPGPRLAQAVIAGPTFANVAGSITLLPARLEALALLSERSKSSEAERRLRFS